ncbi:hypothetical protein J6E39_09260 [bacterium]|nr:hypothetical protein [bacterium]
MIISKISSNPIYTNYFQNKIQKNNNYTIAPLQSDSFVRNVNSTQIPAFTGKNINFDTVAKLTDHFAKRPYSKKHAEKVATSVNYADAFGITGELPESWTKKISNIKDFDKSSFCERLGEIFTIDRHEANIDILTDNLRKLFKDHGIISDENMLTTEYIGKGFFGRDFRISIGDNDDKVIKEFKRTYRYHNNHGNYSEQNLGEHLKKYGGTDTEIVPYYYGDTQNGILITKFISKESPNPTGKIDLEDLGMAYDDGFARNYVNDWIVDVGGMITINNLVGRPISQNIFKQFKHAKEGENLISKFDDIMTKTLNTDEKKYNDTMVGLAHSIRFLPEERQGEFYNKMHNLKLQDVDIAIIEESDKFSYLMDRSSLFESLAKTDNIEIKKAISRKIKNIPSPLKDKIFEEYSANETNHSIKKYLARNLNHYYKNISNRINIFDNLAKDADKYANIALINSMKWIGESKVEQRYAEMFEKGDIVTRCALARNIEIFKENPKVLEKWLDKFMEIDDFRVKRAMAESVKFLPKEFEKKTFEGLLDINDNNTKEFLAETITSIPGYQNHKDWLLKILKDGDNSIRRSLAGELPKIKDAKVRQEWTQIILDGADSSVRKIVDSQK